MKKIVLGLIFAALTVGFISGQEAENNAGGGEPEYIPGYRIEEDGRIIQTLTWDRTNAYYYEVEIQQRDQTGDWEDYTTERTEEIFLELSLPPGMYRYRILSYNVLGRVAAASGWTGIRIYPALEPVVQSFSPEAFHVDSHEEVFTLTLLGRDIQDVATVYIIAKTENAAPVEPLSTQPSEDGASLFATFSKGLTLGDYDIVVTNPGGLRTVIEGFAVSFTRPVDISLSLGYAPILPITGSLFSGYDRSIYLLGFYGRFSVVPLKRLWGSIGMEIDARFVEMTTEGLTMDNRSFTLKGQLLPGTLNFLYQRWFRDYTMTLNFRLGGGVATVLNMQYNHDNGSDSEKPQVIYAAITAGASWQWYVWRGLFIELGLDYIQLISGSGTLPASIIQPKLGVGLKF
jgi:hypothetical protein